MPGANGHPLGRDEELARVQRSIEHAPSGLHGLLFEGEAGIGKTTVWREAIERAHAAGIEVLATRPVEAETGFSYAALADLFGSVLDGVLPDLPVPQRRAIQVALLRADTAGVSPDQQAVSMATLGVLRSLATDRPIVIAIDDIQWMDRSSARVLGFALRRLTSSPVGIFATLRTGLPIPSDLALALPEEIATRMHIGPLAAKDVAAMVRHHLDADLPRPLVVRLEEASGGNPFYALEIARALLRQERWPGAGEPLPVSGDLHQLLSARIAALSPSAGNALLPVAATTRPTEDLVLAAASGRRDRLQSGLIEAEAAGIILRDVGRIRFTHPLLGSTLYTGATPDARRVVHGRLAELAPDPEERARHLAHSITKPDREVARALDGAARHARARGAPDAAAELAGLAAKLTPPEEDRDIRRRSVEAAEYSFDAGDAARAIELLEQAIDASPPGPERAEILFHLSSMSWMNLERGVRAPLVRAIPEAVGNDALLSGIHQGIAWVDLYQGDLAASAEHAQRSVDHAVGVDDAATRADALATYAAIQFLSGDRADEELAEALRLQDVGMASGSWTEASVYTTPRSILGLEKMWAGELNSARSLFEHELAEYESHAMYTVRQEVLCYLAELECRAGRWQVAADYAAEAMETVIESGQTATQTHVVLFNQAYAAAHLGHVDLAREMATEGERLAGSNDDTFNANWNRAVLGFIDLSLSDYERAHAHLTPVIEYLDRMSPAEPGVIPCIPDDIEALVWLGRLDEADDVLGRFVARARAIERPWARAAAARCRSLIAAARSNPAAAILASEQAVAEHKRSSQPFELGRTLLVKGEVERRAKHRRAARESLEGAVGIFERLGATLWADRARAEQSRVGGAITPPGELTPSERRVADLAMQGMTNREAAGTMFVSVKTVEANLSRAYHKLGISSRRELRAVLEPASANEEPDPAPS